MKYYSKRLEWLRKFDWEDQVTFMDDNPESDLFTVFEKDYMRRYYKYAERMGEYKNAEYPAVGIMDRNDLVQEAHLAFLEALRKKEEANFSEVAQAERGAAEWSYINNSAKLNFAKKIRQLKDGVRVPEREQFDYGGGNAKTNILTQYFPDLELIFEEIMEPHWDKWAQLVNKETVDFLIRKVCNGVNDRIVLKGSYGIGYNNPHSQKVIARALGTTPKAVERIKDKLMKKLRELKPQILKTIVESDGNLTQEGWKLYKEMKSFRGILGKAWLIKHVGAIEKQKVDAYSKLGIDVTDRNSYALHAYRVHGESPKSEELFSDRSSALKSLWDIESSDSTRIIEDDHDFYNIFVRTNTINDEEAE